MSLFSVPSDNKPTKGKKVKQGCEGCDLQYIARNPKMPIYGEGKKEILIVTDTLSEDDDFEGHPLSDEYGDLLKYELRKYNVHLFKDCWVTSAIRCSCEAANSNDKLIDQCGKQVLTDIRKLKPKVVILLGRAAVKAVINSRLTGRLAGTDYISFYGDMIPDQQLKTYLCPTYHPKEIKKTESKYDKKPDVIYLKNWRDNLEAACKKATDKKYEFPDYEKLREKKRIIWDVDSAIKFLETMKDVWEKGQEDIAHDYETSGLKNQAAGHFIECVSIADKRESVCMPFFRKNKIFCKAYEAIMVSRKIGKVAHNNCYEDSWTYNKAHHETMPKYKTAGWRWDTLLGWHCIHNQKPTGQKYLVYRNYGIINYDEHISKFLGSNDEDNKNSFNTVHKAPKQELYDYCAEDSLFCFKLYQDQKAWFEKHPHLLDGFLFLLEGQMSLSSLHINGQGFDIERAIEAKVSLEQEIKQKILELRTSEWGEGWDGKTGGDNVYNHIYKTLGLKNIDEKKTGAGKDALDEDVMEKMDHPFTDSILEIKKLEKVLSTYMEGYLRETVDGFVHSFFRLLTKTLRSNSDSPNAQNIPKRNKKVKKILRSCFVPRPDSRIMEWDYKALETIIAACNYPDPNWIEYVSDLSSDMHWDWTYKMFEFTDDFVDILIEEDIKDDIRSWVKNGAVFPGIYGSSYVAISSSLYKIMKRIPTMWDYFGEKGWHDYKKFKNHLKAMYEWYWTEWFPTYKELREEDYKKYLKDGYTDTLNGFRYQGPMSYTEFCNWKTQGPASHIKLWTLKETEKEIEEEQMESKLICEVHDAIVGDVVNGEETEMSRLINHIGTVSVREHWTWIIVPLVIDGEQSKVNGNWAEMEKFKL